jgi:site-specific DNA recombinase
MSAKRAINYARVSTPRQAELYSLDYQLEQEQAYDAEMGFVVIAEFRDDQSGRRIDRDGLEEACQMLERDEADVLITWKFDRLHRNYVNSVVLRERIRKVGKDIHYAQSRQVSGKTARERLPEDLQFIMAEIDADTILENTTGGRLRKAKAGKWIGLNKPPYGYQRSGRGHDAAMEIYEKQAAIVRLVFLWYVIGEGESGPLSTDAIAKRLIAMGTPTPLDDMQQENPTRKRAFGQWNRGSIYKILNQPAYMGIFYQYRYKQVGGNRVINPNKEEWVGVPVPAIISGELYEAAQRRLEKGREISPRASVDTYLVGRRIWCECGYKMRSLNTSKTFTMQNGNVHSYTYHNYVCPGKREVDKTVAHRCDMPIQAVKKVDARVWQWITEEIANPEVLERKLREVQSGQQQKSSTITDGLEALYRNRETVEAELKRIGMLYAKEGMPSHIVDELIAEQSHKLVLTNEEIKRREHDRETPLTDEAIMTLVQFSAAFRQKLETVGKTFEGRRTVIDGLDTKVTVFRKDGEIWLKLQSILRPDGVAVPLAEPFQTEFLSS